MAGNTLSIEARKMETHYALRHENPERKAGNNVFDVGMTKGIPDRVPVHERCMSIYSALARSHDIG